MNEAYFAADALPLEPGALASVAPDLIDGLRLSPHPSLRLVASRFPIDAIWEANQEGGDGVVDLRQGGANVAVLRPKLTVVYRPLAAGSFALVAALAGGTTLAEAAAAAETADPTFDLQTALIDHLVTGTFSGLVATPA